MAGLGREEALIQEKDGFRAVSGAEMSSER